MKMTAEVAVHTWTKSIFTGKFRKIS